MSLLQLGHALFQPGSARLELRFVDDAFGIAVDEPADPAPQAGYLTIEVKYLVWRGGAIARLSDAPTVFMGYAIRLLQESFHLVPNDLLQFISAVDPGRGDRLRARTLVGPDAVPGGRAAGAGHKHCRAFDPADIHRRKKEWSVCGNEGGGETWAILASLLNTCKLHSVDPEIYLTDVLERMVSGATKNNRLHELLVWNWKAAREAEKAAA